MRQLHTLRCSNVECQRIRIQNDQLTRQIEREERQNKLLEGGVERCRELRISLNQTEKELREKDEALTRETFDKKQIKHENTSLQSRLNQTERELREKYEALTREALDKKQIKHENTSLQSRLNQTERELREKNEALTRETLDKKQIKYENTSLRFRIQLNEREIRDLKGKIKKGMDDKNRMNKENRSLECRLESRDRELKDLNMKHTKAVRDMKDEMRGLQTKLQRSDENARELNRKMDIEVREKNKKNAENTSLQFRLDQYATELSDLHIKYEMEVQAKNQKNNENEELQARLSRTVSQYEQEKIRAGDMQRDTEMVQNKLRKAESELIQITEDIRHRELFIQHLTINCEKWKKEYELACSCEYLPTEFVAMETSWLISNIDLYQCEEELETSLREIKQYQKQQERYQKILKEKDNEIIELHRQICSNNQRIAALKIKLQGSKQEQTQLILQYSHGRHYIIQDAIPSLQQTREINEGNKTELEKTLILLEHQLKDTKAELRKCCGEKQTLVTEVEFLQRQNKELNNTNQKAELQNSRLFKQLELKAEENKELSQRLASESNRASFAESKWQDLENRLADNTSAIERTEQDLFLAENIKNDIRTNFENAKLQIQGLEDDIGILRQQVEEKDIKLKVLIDCQSKNAKMEKEITELKATIENLTVHERENEKEAEQLKQQLSDLLTETLHQHKSGFCDTGRANGNEIAVDSHAVTEKELLHLKAKWSTHQSELSDLQHKYDEIQIALNDKQRETEKLLASLQAKNTETKQLKIKGKELEANVLDTNNQYSELQSKYNQVCSVLEDKNSKIDYLSERLESVTAEYQSAKQKLTDTNFSFNSSQLQSQLQQLQSEYDSKCQLLKEKDEELKELLRKENGESQILKETLQRLDESSSDINALQTECDRMRNMLRESEQNFRNVSDKLEIEQTKNSKLQKQVKSLGEINSTCESQHDLQFSQLRTQYEDACITAREHQEKITKLVERLETEQLKNSELQKEVKSLGESNSACDVQLSQLHTQFEDACAIIQEQEGKITNLVERLSKEETNCSQAHSRNREIQQTLSKSQNEYEKACNRLREKEKQFEDLSKRLRQEENSHFQAQTQNRELQQTAHKTETLLSKSRDDYEKACNRLMEKDKQIEDLSKRLSKEMGQKVSSDESSLENVSIKNRPINIASEYELLCSNQWLSAKTDLDEKCPQLNEAERMRLLNDILMTGHKEGESMKKCLLDVIMYTLYNPGAAAKGPTPKSASEMPEVMKNYVLDFMRSTADKANLSFLIQRIRHHIENNPLGGQVFVDPGIQEYLDSAALIAWKMILQRPVMTLQQRGIGEEWQGENKQELFWSSSDPKDPRSRVKYYVHPSLYHGDAMMVKGRVYLEKAT